MAETDRRVGITTTIPVEVVLAADLQPVDLNNLFVSHPDRDGLVEIAEQEGFPQGSCAWLKGIFGAVASGEGPRRVAGVVRGDCSGTDVLLEALEQRGVEVIRFAYPSPPERGNMERELLGLCEALNTTLEEAEVFRERILPVRALLAEADRQCWEENILTGEEAHRWLVSSSDFGGDPWEFHDSLAAFLRSARGRKPLDTRGGMPFAREVRLGYMGVPPMEPGLFPLVESAGARFVFHEVQRQYSMPERAGDLAGQYLAYSYPYSLSGRALDINAQSSLRRLDGIVHYVQSFCHRNMEDVIFSRLLHLPLLTIECDCPGGLGAAALARLESFVQVLGENLDD